MNFERVLERLRDYRLQNEHFDRLVGAVLANKLAARGVHALVASAAKSGARSRNTHPAKVSRQYKMAFFIVGEMRSGTSWLRRTLSAHPEIACGHEASFFGRAYDHEDIPVYPGPVSSLSRALADR